MTKRNIILPILLFVFIFGGCRGEKTTMPTPTPSPKAETASSPTPVPVPSLDPMGERIAEMTVEELAGQLLVAGIEGKSPGEDARQAIENLHVGGIILFRRNVASGDQLAKLTNALKALNTGAGNLPLFLCVDQEGGLVSRTPPEVAQLSSAYDFIQKGGDPAALGRVLGAECAAFGFNVDFAPVLDVWSNSKNTVIGKRAFGTGAEEAAQAGTECALGLMEAGIIPVGKHFPGHGDTETDSHLGLPVVKKGVEELEELELIPFRRAVEGGVPALMAAHILMTELDPILPASLSPAVVDGLLREELGFDGLVFTDDLTMGAITHSYGMGEATVKAVEAGCDMALVCHGLDNVKAAYHALLFAVEDGTLSRERLEESVRRILTVKEAYGVDDTPVEIPDIEALNDKIKKITG